MKVAFLQLSDFHLGKNEYISNVKIKRIAACLNPLAFDALFLLLTGDLAATGKKEEYKVFGAFLGKLIEELKKVNDNKYIKIFMVPGNHDIDFPENERTSATIIKNYKDDTVELLLDDEFSFMRNYFEFSSNNCVSVDSNHFAKSVKVPLGKEYFQVNLINTAPFSTKQPDNKELHYFPEKELQCLNRKPDVSFCLTVMHHSVDWFNWRFKTHLERAIVSNSEFLFYGHDHEDENKTISLNDGNYIWVSASGEMKICQETAVDSFNIIIIDTNDEVFCSYQYEWHYDEKIYHCNPVVLNKKLPKRTEILEPIFSFVAELKEDKDIQENDFTRYFVFPKLIKVKDESHKDKDIDSIERLQTFISNKKRIVITGSPNSGKTTLLKKLFLSYIGEKAPLYLHVDQITKFSTKNFVRNLFEDCYGKNASYEKYQQLNKDSKILIIDGWDLLKLGKSENAFLEQLLEQFEYIVFSVTSRNTSLIEDAKESINENAKFQELRIKPFYRQKRNEIISRICEYKNIPESTITTINNSIEAIIKNNSELFVLTPAFIIKYINVFLKSPTYDYAKGEEIFSEVYRLSIYQTINAAKWGNEYLDELLIAFEELAGFMYMNRKDVLKSDEFIQVIDKYTYDYGVAINPKRVLSVGLETGILIQQGDLSLYFANKNHLTFFIASYLIRECEGNLLQSEGLQYAIRNICFGINSDIVLFASYSLNSKTLIDKIITEADALISKWEKVSLDEKNIRLLSLNSSTVITPPSEEEEKEYLEQKEKHEELSYTEDIIEAKGLFEYDEEDIDLLQNEILRAIRYTEIICKVLPSFNLTTRVSEKQKYVNYIYTYPRKILYTSLRPLDIHFEDICNDLLSYANDNNYRKRNGEEYAIEDIKMLLFNIARIMLIGLFDHFAELCTNKKTIQLLCSREPEDSSEIIERLLMVHNSGNSEQLLKETDRLLKSKAHTSIKEMGKIVVKKHILQNENMPKNLKQSMSDKILEPKRRKNFV